MSQPANDESPYQIRMEPVSEAGDYRDVYELPDGTEIHLGAKFWDADRKCLYEVTSVEQKVRLDQRGEEMSRGAVNVFFDSDHPKDSEGGWSSNRNIPEDVFVDRLDKEEFIPHGGNWYLPPNLRI